MLSINFWSCSLTSGILGVTYPLLMAAMLGIGDGVLNTQLSALLGILFKHDMVCIYPIISLLDLFVLWNVRSPSISSTSSLFIWISQRFFLFLTMTEYDNVKIKSGASYLCHLHRTGNMNSSLDSDADMVPELMSIIKTTTWFCVLNEGKIEVLLLEFFL